MPDQNQQSIAPKNKKGLKIFLAILVVLLVGVIGYVVLFLVPQAVVAPGASEVASKKEKVIMCGGVAGIKCQNGMICKMSGNYPDAAGICVKVESTNEVDTSDWQIYRNEELGFEFKYPDSWFSYNIKKIREDGAFDYLIDKAKLPSLVFESYEYKDRPIETPSFSFNVIRFSNIESYYKSVKNETCTNLVERKINGLTFFEFHCTEFIGDNYYITEQCGLVFSFSASAIFKANLETIINTFTVDCKIN